jgi:hypothetical protein
MSLSQAVVVPTSKSMTANVVHFLNAIPLV